MARVFFGPTLLASVLFATACQADTYDRRVNIVNETSFTIVEFYASNVSVDVWEEDILGADVLDPGQSVLINIDDGSEYCEYDIRAVFSDGEEVVRNALNVCEVGTFTFTE